MGPELAVGMLIAWVIAKTRRAGKQLDGVADQMVDAAAVRVRELVLGKLGADSAVQQLLLEGEQGGEVSDRTRRRVELALEDVTEKDTQFAIELRAALATAAESANIHLEDTHGGTAISGSASASGAGGSAIGAIGAVGGNLSTGQASDPR